MNALANHANLHYQRAQVESASPGKLLLMLYDGAIRRLHQSTQALEDGRRDDFQFQTHRVQKILTELMGALDHEKGGDVSVNLERLYDYMIRQLALAMLRCEPDNVHEVRVLLEQLREAWQEAVAKSVQPAQNEELEFQSPEKTFFNSEMAVAGQPLTPCLNIAG